MPRQGKTTPARTRDCGGRIVCGKRPVNERVAAGVSYKDMLGEVGAIGAFVIFGFIARELSRVFEVPGSDKILLGCLDVPSVIAGGVAAVLFLLFTRSLGQPLFVFLMLIMLPLATTELGTDGAISSLMESQMKAINEHLGGGHLLVYTSLIMMVLRFFAGPIVHRLSPLGLLALSAPRGGGGLGLPFESHRCHRM